jgi:transposase
LKSKLNFAYKLFDKVEKQSITKEIHLARVVTAHLLSHSILSGKVIVNVDESSFEDLYLSKRTWIQRGQRKSIVNLLLLLRVTLITAITSDNDIFVMKCNKTVDHEVFNHFMAQLIEALARKYANYKQQCLFLLDNAKIHKDAEVKSFYKRENLQVLFIAPYSPQFAPVEFVFAHLKKRLQDMTDIIFDKKVTISFFILCCRKLTGNSTHSNDLDLS